MNIGERIDSAGDWLRARTNRYQKVARETADPPGVIPLSLVKGAKFASWVAFFVLMYFLWERVLAVSEAKYETLHVTHFGPWTLDLSIFFPLIIGYLGIVICVPYVAKIAIPLLVSLNWREHFWPKLWAAFITGLVSIVLITGTATVGSDAIIESERDSAVAVAQVQQEQAVLDSRIAAAEEELRGMMHHPNTYFAIAASMSPEEYQRTYIDARRGDWQYDRFVSAMGASRDAQALRERISGLRDERARATVAQSVSSDVSTARTGPLNAIMGFLNAFWVLLLAAVADIVCLIMPWIALRLEQARARQLAETGAEAITNEGFMIEDLRDDDPGPIQPLEPIKEVMKDVATGEEIKYAQVPAHMRRIVPRKKKKGEPIEVNVAGVAVEERNRTTDGGARTGLSPEQIAAQMQPGNVLAGAASAPPSVNVERPAGDDYGEENREPVRLDGDSESVAINHAPDSTPASLEQEAPIFSADEMSAFDEAPLGLGENGDDGVMIKEREKEDA